MGYLDSRFRGNDEMPATTFLTQRIPSFKKKRQVWP